MCRLADIGMYLCKIFSQKVVLAIAAVFSWIGSILFPEPMYLYGALAVFSLIIVDLLTRLVAIKRQSGGWAKAFTKHKINSKSFAKGTINKMMVFMVLMIMSAAAYQMMIIADVAIWFTQFVFVFLFITEGISILENLMDAGCNVGFLKKVLKKKLEDYAGCTPDTTAVEVKKPVETDNIL